MSDTPEVKVTQSKLAFLISSLGICGLVLGAWTQWNDIQFRLRAVEVTQVDNRKTSDERYTSLTADLMQVRQEAIRRDEKWNDTIGKLNETLAQINLTLKEVQVIQRVKP